MSIRSALAALALVATATAAAQPAHADAVSDWFAVVQEITGRVPPASDPVAEQATPLVALAMYDAIVAVEGGYKPYLGQLKAPRGASAAAAAHAAAHSMLVHLYPQEQAWLDGNYEWSLAAMPDDAGRAKGIVIGVHAARRLIAHRDHAAVDATAYTSDYAEVLALGGLRDSRRTPAQGEIARFWHSTDITQLLPPVFAREGRTLAQNARLFAVFSTAMFDAGILLARDKYHYDFWRPVTAIRNGDEDGNAATTRDATWEPLLATPSHPDYPCGHCTVGALVAEIMTAETGNAPAGGILVAGPADATRHYESFAGMAEEISNSRVWGGVHFRQGASDGAELGRRLARHILTSAFTRLP